MTEIIKFSGITAQVMRKSIKYVHLSVCPPAGTVRISAPHRIELEAIRLFAASRLDWIRRNQNRFWAQERETPREYLPRESHYVWGRRCLLTIAEKNAPPTVEWNRDSLKIITRPNADAIKKHAVLSSWYRQQVRQAAEKLIQKWQPQMNVSVSRLFVRQMKTRWGVCNTRTGAIRLNTDLAKKHPACLEYIVVHEMTHLLERRHNERFMRLMDGFLPQWRQLQNMLERAPLSATRWN